MFTCSYMFIGYSNIWPVYAWKYGQINETAITDSCAHLSIVYERAYLPLKMGFIFNRERVLFKFCLVAEDSLLLPIFVICIRAVHRSPGRARFSSFSSCNRNSRGNSYIRCACNAAVAPQGRLVPTRGEHTKDISDRGIPIKCS